MTLEGKELILRTIEYPVIKYVAMIIGHKVCLPSNDLIVSTIVVHTTIDMVRRGMDYDLCELLQVYLLKKLRRARRVHFNMEI